MTSSSGKYQVEVLLDQCKFYPVKRLAVLGGSVISIHDKENGGSSFGIRQNDRCLVYYSEEDGIVSSAPSVSSLM
eukprot:CAMPEP_0178769632 /NCGR_PEP_ID=MMETSP0744-20121128/20940_1 /TAXON_ID=913974 /ORGANISM="Nitzschia punctata, Strain CCMP561" /LENGTH=74 /DNA_ID=CAMNT_0020425911 /DNA_START=85 /DNA_END=306 /DNA_ORIENTATION=-